MLVGKLDFMKVVCYVVSLSFIANHFCLIATMHGQIASSNCNLSKSILEFSHIDGIYMGTREGHTMGTFVLEKDRCVDVGHVATTQ